jgi:hypothetical protein
MSAWVKKRERRMTSIRLPRDNETIYGPSSFPAARSRTKCFYDLAAKME